MNYNLFRKKSIESINSTKQLNEYIHINSPSIWVIILSIVILLVGIIVWSIFGTITSTINTVIVKENENTICYIDDRNLDSIKNGMTVYVQGQEGTIQNISNTPIQFDKKTDAYILYVGDFSSDSFYFIADVEIDDIKEGVYPAKIEIENTNPITFIIK